MNQEAAQVLALQALGWIASEDDVFPAFVATTGAAIGDLRARASDPVFLAAVVDFLLMDDQWVVAFCDAASHPYTAPQAARAALPGGEITNWT